MADKRAKPAKPYPDFPLTAHANGQWCKKIRGKVYFFRVWDDPAAALQKYVDQRDDLQAGRQPRRLSGNELTVGQLCNHFLTAKESRVLTGELEPRTFQGYHKSCEQLVKRLRKRLLVDDLRPTDFDKLRNALAKGKSPNSISNEVIRVRMVFKYAYDAALIERPMRFGPNFTKAPKRSVRKAENDRTPRLFTPEQRRIILRAADVPMTAAVYLGLNCAFGASDIAALRRESFDLASGWVVHPRVKTAVPRRIPPFHPAPTTRTPSPNENCCPVKDEQGRQKRSQAAPSRVDSKRAMHR